MEFDFTVPGLGNSSITMWDSTVIRNLSPADIDHLKTIVDAFGKRSAQAQGLSAPITDVMRLRCTDQRLFLFASRQPGGRTMVLGGLKVGHKRLWVSASMGALREVEPMCILDFYVHESCQRQGIGKQLFEHFLELDGCDPAALAYDRPSPKLMAFLHRYYGLTEHVPQSNNFVLFDKYWQVQSGQTPTPPSLTRTTSNRRPPSGPSAPNGFNGNGMSGYQPTPQRLPSPARAMPPTMGSSPGSGMPYAASASPYGGPSSSPYGPPSPSPYSAAATSPYATASIAPSYPLPGGGGAAPSMYGGYANGAGGGGPPSMYGGGGAQSYGGMVPQSPPGGYPDDREDSIDRFRVQAEAVTRGMPGGTASSSAYSSPGSTLMGHRGPDNDSVLPRVPPPIRSTSFNGGLSGAASCLTSSGTQEYDTYQTSSQRMSAGMGFVPSAMPQQRASPVPDPFLAPLPHAGRHSNTPMPSSSAPWADGGTWSAGALAPTHHAAPSSMQTPTMLQTPWGTSAAEYPPARTSGGGGGYGGGAAGNGGYGGGSVTGGGMVSPSVTNTSRVNGAQQRAGSGAANCLVW